MTARDDVGRIVAADLAPLANEIDRQGLYPETVLRRLGEAGLFAAHVGRWRSVVGWRDIANGRRIGVIVYIRCWLGAGRNQHSHRADGQEV